MEEKQYFKNRVFSISNEAEFERLAIELFHFQAAHNPVYAQFIRGLGVKPADISRLTDIPFLPISAFKTHQVVCGEPTKSTEFTSSGTTGARSSRHLVPDLEHYEQSFMKGWQHFFDPIEDYAVLALLPSYLERHGSSLIYMVEHFIKASSDPDSGFYLDQLEELYQLLLQKIAEGKPTLFIGVSFALLDLAERFELPPNKLIIMETGGMKGRRKEMIRSELHAILKKRFGVESVYSEYGMTELLSQAYSKGEGLFACPPWMKVLVRETDDPLSYARPGKTGGLNVIDLANIDSCAFIATEDLARSHPGGIFEVMGRFDNSDIRGCNLMVI